MAPEKLLGFVVPADATLLDAASKIQGNRSRVVVAVNGEKVVGVVSEGDILRTLLQGGSVYNRIDTCIRHSFKYLKSYDIEAAWKLVRDHGITMVPVLTKDGGLEDVITLQDIFERLELRN